MILGKKINYPNKYDASFLLPISRSKGRKEISYKTSSFNGFDLWTIYEFSHYLKENIPTNKIITFEYKQSSLFLIESKSLKYYINSFNNEVFDTESDAIRLFRETLSDTINSDVVCHSIQNLEKIYFKEYSFFCVDNLKPLTLPRSNHNSISFLERDSITKPQRLFSRLFRSLCPVTGQPDWASIYIAISGKVGLSELSFLSYILSFRNHQAFHEQCVEKIIQDISDITQAEHIGVYARFTRRGGIDINPFRYKGKIDPELKKMVEKSKYLLFKDERQ